MRGPETPERSLCRYDRLLTIIICFVTLCESLGEVADTGPGKLIPRRKSGRERDVNGSIVRIIIEFHIFVEPSAAFSSYPGKCTAVGLRKLFSSGVRDCVLAVENEEHGDLEGVES